MWILDEGSFEPSRPVAPRVRLMPQRAAWLLLYLWLCAATPFALIFALVALLGHRANRLLGAMATLTSILRSASRQTAKRSVGVGR